MFLEKNRKNLLPFLFPLEVDLGVGVDVVVDVDDDLDDDLDEDEEDDEMEEGDLILLEMTNPSLALQIRRQIQLKRDHQNQGPDSLTPAQKRREALMQERRMFEYVYHGFYTIQGERNLDMYETNSKNSNLYFFKNKAPYIR